jgi:CO dehydrogenase nickel-insertion accessory protein CooC1
MVPLIIIVGADKGGVGKTMIARALLDFLEDKGVRPSVFDTEPDPGVLRRFYKNAKPVDVGVVRGQMRVSSQ